MRLDLRSGVEREEGVLIEEGEEERSDAGLPVTQSDDPLSGGHLERGTSKSPLWKVEYAG